MKVAKQDTAKCRNVGMLMSFAPLLLDCCLPTIFGAVVMTSNIEQVQ
jgi:hypothetical protein